LTSTRRSLARGVTLAVGLAGLGVGALACDRCSNSRAGEASPPPAAASPAAPAGFLKGQLHLHTGESADSATPPSRAVSWYAERGYDFIVITDHNTITSTPAPASMLVLRGVELTQNLRHCEPPPEPGLSCLLHVDALLVTAPPGPTPFPPTEDTRRTALYGRAADRAQALGGIAQLNHPNFHRAVDPELVVDLARRGVRLLEIANMALDSDNAGDDRHPSTEALWDAALSRGVTLYGTATDDAHHYDDADDVRARGGIAYVGDRGWIMVRTTKPKSDVTADDLRSALARGDFYASTGITLSRVELSPTRLFLEVAADAGADGAAHFEVVGAGGELIATSDGTTLDVDPRPWLEGSGEIRRYVRVRVTGSRGERAWTQPVFAAHSPKETP
jgi:hypothetical protein